MEQDSARYDVTGRSPSHPVVRSNLLKLNNPSFLALGAFHYSLHVIFIAVAMDVAGAEVQVTGVSLIYRGSFLGTVAPVLAGVIADASGYPDAFLCSGGVVLVSALIMAPIRLPKTTTQLE